MKISIITATWNSAATVCDTIESVLGQDYQDWEHVIVDGGSTDETLEIVKDHEPTYNGRVRVFIGKDNGIYDAMNKGIAYATGDIVGILNSDDFFADTHVLSKIAEYISGVQSVYGNLDFVKSDDTAIIVRQWIGSQHMPGAFCKGWHPAHPTFYARKECFEQAGGFDLSLDVSADFELMLRFLEKEQFSSRYVPYTFVKMRMGGESTGSISKIIRGNKNVLRAFEKNGISRPPFYLIRRLAPKAINMIKTKLKI